MTPDKDRFKQLPKRVRLEDTITTAETEPVPDPDGDRDPDRDFLIRYGLGGV